MKINGILIHPVDHVVTLSAAVKADETVFYLKDGKLYSQTAAEEIPQYHKMAVVPIEKGQRILKYGAKIGEAIREIPAGNWVHRHNLQSIGTILKKGAGCETESAFCEETGRERSCEDI